MRTTPRFRRREGEEWEGGKGKKEWDLLQKSNNLWLTRWGTTFKFDPSVFILFQFLVCILDGISMGSDVVFPWGDGLLSVTVSQPAGPSAVPALARQVTLAGDELLGGSQLCAVALVALLVWVCILRC